MVTDNKSVKIMHDERSADYTTPVRTCNCSGTSTSSTERTQNFNMIHTLANILNRDQRTVFPPMIYDCTGNVYKLDNNQNLTIFKCECPCHILARNSYKNIYIKKSSYRTFGKKIVSSTFSSRWRNLFRSLNRLGELLFWGICILSLVRVPMALCAPTRNMSPPKWENPCGDQGHREYTDSEMVDFVGGGNNADLANQIVVIAKNALSYAQLFRDNYVSPQNHSSRIVVQGEHALEKSNNFRDNYVKKTFSREFLRHHEAWIDNHYDWLPTWSEIPKNLGEPVPAQHLHSLKFGEALRNTYEYLQKFAVGLEQIVWDMEANKNEFEYKFKESEYKLRQTLCEIQVAMAEQGNIEPKPNVSRDIMPEDYRVMLTTSNRIIRDWLIFRDYMNGLEYVIQVFEYFKNRPNQDF